MSIKRKKFFFLVSTSQILFHGYLIFSCRPEWYYRIGFPQQYELGLTQMYSHEQKLSTVTLTVVGGIERPREKSKVVNIESTV